MDALIQSLSLGHSGWGAPLHVLEDTFGVLTRLLAGENDDSTALRTSKVATSVANKLTEAVTKGATAVETCGRPSQALLDYTLGSSAETNALLRSSMGQKSDEISTALDGLMRPTEHSFQVYRSAEQRFVPQGLQVGDEFIDNAFISTTKRASALKDIIEDTGQILLSETEKMVEFTITVPRGYKVIDVNTNLGRAHDYAYQEEIILRRGTQFAVTAVKETERTVYYTLEVVH